MTKLKYLLGYCYKCGRDIETDYCDECQINVEGNNMIALKPGTVLEREYKGEKVKVVVGKDGESYKFNGKVYDERGALMKAITKGKIAQFTNFFGLGKTREEGTNGAEPKHIKKSTSAEPTVAKTEQGTIEGIIRTIVREEIKTFFQNADI